MEYQFFTMNTSYALSERQEVQTRLLRVGLAVDESRAYWRLADPTKRSHDLVETAFEEQWFGTKSFQRVSYLINTVSDRIGGGTEELLAWDPENPQDRAWVCHWHLQRTDIIYRQFTDQYVCGLLKSDDPTLEKASTLEWLHTLAPGRWSGSTADRLATGLISSLSEAGYCDITPLPRPLVAPELSDHALAYLLYLLKRMTFEGSLLDNPYLRSSTVEIDLQERLQHLPQIEAEPGDGSGGLQWKHDTFTGWMKSL